MTDTPLIRAAKAAAELYGDDWGKLPEVNPLANTELDREFFREIARAVLEAVREPSGGMMAAATRLWWLDFNGDEEVELRVTPTQTHQIWHAMIDAALSE